MSVSKLHSLIRRVLDRPQPNPPPVVENAQDAAFRRFVTSKLDPQAYTKASPDVAATGMDPVEHWLEYGLYEGRMLAPGLIVRRGAAAMQPRDADMIRFTWRGEAIAFFGPLAASMMRQIVMQAQHEPAVLAPGALALPYLRRCEARDLLDRDGVDVAALFDAVPELPKTVLVIPKLVVGGAEKYAADLIDTLVAAGGGPALVLVTEQTMKEAEGWRKSSILAPLYDLPMIFWRDACGISDRDYSLFLARFLHALRPKAIVVINSRLGLDTVARYGRGLSQGSRLCCAYFSMGMHGLSAPYGTRFPRLTLPFALALTDNAPMAATLKRLYGGLPGPGIAVLPARIQPVPESVFAARLAARRERIAAVARPCCWAWVSRVESFKGTAILGALAALCPEERFEIFGPVDGTLEDLGLALPNIFYRGVLENIDNADFAAYDGFVFTSQFEGMPNIVLEMSQHAIPMALADVGGLRDTLDDQAALFVQPAQTTAETAAAFAEALGQVASFTADQATSMAQAALTQIMARHAPANHARMAAQIFGLS